MAVNAALRLTRVAAEQTWLRLLLFPVMAEDRQHENEVEGDEVGLASRALIVPTVQLTSVTFTPLLTVLAAQLSGGPSESLSNYSAAMESYRVVAARVPQASGADFEDAVFEEE